MRGIVQLLWLAESHPVPAIQQSPHVQSFNVRHQLMLLLSTACTTRTSATAALLCLFEAVVPPPSTLPPRHGDVLRVAGQIIFVLENLLGCCRAALMSFTTLPDGVEEGGPAPLPDDLLNENEQSAINVGLFRRLVDLVLRFPTPFVELNYANILQRLNGQLHDLESEHTSRNVREEDRTPLSDTVIQHPRHPHRLHWQCLDHLPEYVECGYVCDRCAVGQATDAVSFHCRVCRFDICAECSFVTIPASAEVQRARRWGYALVVSDGTIASALRLLCHPNCTSDMGLETVRFLRRGIKESARRDTGVLDKESPIAVIERVVVELASELTAEIHARVKAFRNSFLTGSLGGSDPTRQWTAQEAGAALSHLNLDSTKDQCHALFLPYAETHRPEPREVTLMWHASQMYLAEVAAVLQRLRSRSSVLLPHAVLLLLNGFCQFHLAESRRSGSFTSVAGENSFSTEKTETERFMLDSTHTTSTVSDAAVAALLRAEMQGRQQQQQQPQQQHQPLDPRSGYAAFFAGPRLTVSESEIVPTAAPVSAAASPVDNAQRQGEAGREERPILPRVVRQFVERNKITINALIQYDQKLLEENFSFLKFEPGFIDFNIRLVDFRRHIAHNVATTRISLNINRNNCLGDSFTQLSNLKNYHGSLNIRFRGEEGADAGGLTREWFQLLAEEMVNDNYALFIHSREGMTYQPNPFSDVNPNHLQYFRFSGIIVGMAVAHGVPIDVHFTRAVYRHMAGVQPIFRDLESVDPELYENLNWLLKNDVNDLGLFFTVNRERFGAIQEAELIPNGAHIPVTNGNKAQYVRMRCEFHMTKQIEPQMTEFLQGFYTVVPRKEIRNFTAQELELVICGTPDIDVEDLRTHTHYEGYTAASPQIRWFWEVVAAMNKEDRANLLQFATGASKVPHGGFSNLESSTGSPLRFTITKWEESADLLPQAHTCFNKIDLPEYPTCEDLRKKLMLAISYGSMGFSML